MPEFENRYTPEHYSGMMRPDPNINTRSTLRAPAAEVPRPFRGRYNAVNVGGTNGFMQILGDNQNRCYLEISNDSDVEMQFRLGSSPGIIKVAAGASWWSPVAPVDAVYINVPADKTCTVISATD